MPQRVHVVPHDGGWAYKHEGDEQPVETFSTQSDAETAAKAHAREHGDTEVVLHGQDGRIRDSDTMDRAHEGPGRDSVH